MRAVVIAIAVLTCGCSGARKDPVAPAAPATAPPAPSEDLAAIVARARTMMDELPAEPVVTVSPETPPVAPGLREVIALLASGVCPGGTEPDYARCTPLPGPPAVVEQAWLLLGTEHFIAGEDAKAIGALRHVATEGSPYRVRAYYLIAWSYYRSGQFPAAIEAFDVVASSPPAPGDPDLHAEAIEYLAICFTEAWVPGEVFRPELALSRAIDRYGDGAPAHAIEVFETIGDALGEMMETAGAAEAYRYTLRRWPGAPHAAAITTKLRAVTVTP